MYVKYLSVNCHIFNSDQTLAINEFRESILRQIDNLSSNHHFAFLYESKIWLGANNSDAAISGIDKLTTPLKKNNNDGITDNANALNILFLLKQTIQMMQ